MAIVKCFLGFLTSSCGVDNSPNRAPGTTCTSGPSFPSDIPDRVPAGLPPGIGLRI